MSPVISSVHNPRIKNAMRLRDRRGRVAQGRMIVEGRREIERGLQANVEFEELFVAEDATESEDTERLLGDFQQRGIATFTVTDSVQARLSFGERESRLVATARIPRLQLADYLPPKDALIAVLVGLEKPGNLGAIVRSADGAGVSAVIVADGGTDLFNPNVIRASLGTIFSLPTFAETGIQTLHWLRARRIPMFSTRVGASRWYYDVPWQPSAAVILGSEAQGLDPAWSAPDIATIAVPMLGIADSLNVSVAAGVIFYEALRQRRST